MMDKKSWLLVILVIVGLTACATTQTTQSGIKEPPLPDDINIIPPSPDLPKEIAGFSGKWRGTWTWGADAILVVEEIHDTWAKVVYSLGYHVSYNVSPRYWRFKCEVIPGPKPKLKWTPPTFPKEPTTFEVKDSNTLEGTQDWVSGDRRGTNTVTMKRTS